MLGRQGGNQEPLFYSFSLEDHVPADLRLGLSSSDFDWDEQAGEYRCLQGHALRSQWRALKNLRTHLTKVDTIIYRSSQSDCATCPIKARRCPNTFIRKIARSVHESARNVARAIAKTAA